MFCNCSLCTAFSINVDLESNSMLVDYRVDGVIVSLPLLESKVFSLVSRSEWHDLCDVLEQ